MTSKRPKTALMRPLNLISSKLQTNIIDENESDELLEELYSMYLQRRLLAQYTYKKMRQELTSQTDETSQLFLNKMVLTKNVFSARYESLRKIAKKLDQLEKLKDLEEHLDLLLELIMKSDTEQLMQKLEKKLSSVGDILYLFNSSPNDDCSNLKSLEESIKQLEKSVEQADGVPFVVMSHCKNFDTLQILEDMSTEEEKKLNENIVQLASLKIAKQLSDRY